MGKMQEPSLTGLPSHPDPWVLLGYHMKDETIVAAWRREGGSPSQTLSMPHLKGVNGQWRCAYPKEDAPPFEWSEESGRLTVQFAQEKMSRIFEFRDLQERRGGLLAALAPWTEE